MYKRNHKRVYKPSWSLHKLNVYTYQHHLLGYLQIVGHLSFVSSAFVQSENFKRAVDKLGNTILLTVNNTSPKHKD